MGSGNWPKVQIKYRQGRVADLYPTYPLGQLFKSLSAFQY